MLISTLLDEAGKPSFSLLQNCGSSGAWLKMHVNQGQELVIGGYPPSLKN
jgi:hypothetical protein